MSCDDCVSKPCSFLIPFSFYGHCILIASVDLRAFYGYGLD